MIPVLSALEIKRDVANVEPYLKMGTADIVTQEMGGLYSLISNQTTQNAVTILSVTVPDGSAAVDFLIVSIWGFWHFNFVSSANTNIWERVIPINSWHQDLVNRNLEVDAIKNGLNLQIRVRIPTVAASSITDFQWHAKVTGRLLSYSVPNTLGFSATAPVGIAPTAHISQLQDKTTIIHNSIKQIQSTNHYGSVGLGKIARILNAATFENGTTTNTAIHIVLDIPPAGISTQTVEIKGSIMRGIPYGLPITSMCHAYLNTATSITKKDYTTAVAGEYTWDFYIATTGAYANKLVLKLVLVIGSALSNTFFIVDTIGGRTGSPAMPVTAIVENTGAYL